MVAAVQWAQLVDKTVWVGELNQVGQIRLVGYARWRDNAQGQLIIHLSRGNAVSLVKISIVVTSGGK